MSTRLESTPERASHATGPAPTGRSWLAFAAACLVPVLVACWVAATRHPEATLVPWRPRMEDLDVYLAAARDLAAGEVPYHPEVLLPYLYPPLAGLLAIPLTWLPLGLVQFLMLAANAVSVAAVLWRAGLTGARLSFATAGLLVLLPLSHGLVLGQIGLLLLAMTVLEATPGRRVLGPATGVLTGIATAIKLTPALFIPFLFLTGRRREAVVATATTVAVTGLAWLVAPAASAHYWGNLVTGDTGAHPSSRGLLGNQSVLSAVQRIAGLEATAPGLLLALVLGCFALAAAIWWQHLGRPWFAVSLVGLAQVLTSPIAWDHHHVWLVVTVVALVRERLPPTLAVLAAWWALWAAAGQWEHLPSDWRTGLEFNYPPLAQLVAATTAVSGSLLAVAALLSAWATGPLPWRDLRQALTAQRKVTTRSAARRIDQ